MGKTSDSDSDTEGDSSEEPISDEENKCKNVEKRRMSEYEKQRQSRIAENKARMEALGLHKMASAIMGSPQKSTSASRSRVLKGKRKVGGGGGGDDDVDYRPDVDDNGDDDNDDEDDEEDEDFVVRKSSSNSRRNKVNKRSPQVKKKVTVQKPLNNEDYSDEEDPDLMQAIAISLQESMKDTFLEGKRQSDQGQKDSGKRKNKKSFSSRVKMTKDEVDLHFFQLDEAGKGFLTLNDLRRVATEHDFSWTNKELTDMIYFFDRHKDRKLNLDDFRNIVERCNMIQEPANS